MSSNFQILEHPSDVGILARGPSREQALIEASHGLTSILVNPASVRPIEERRLVVPGGDEADQVVGWLNETLFFFDAEHMVFAEFHVDSWTSQALEGRALGEALDLQRHEIRTAVKAATYHEFLLRQNGPDWELRVFFDV